MFLVSIRINSLELLWLIQTLTNFSFSLIADCAFVYDNSYITYICAKPCIFVCIVWGLSVNNKTFLIIVKFYYRYSIVNLFVFKFQIIVMVIILCKCVVRLNRRLLRLVTSMCVHVERTSRIVIPSGIIWAMNVAKNHSFSAHTVQLGIHGDLLYRGTFLWNTINSCMENEMQVDKHIGDYVLWN